MAHGGEGMAHGGEGMAHGRWGWQERWRCGNADAQTRIAARCGYGAGRAAAVAPRRMATRHASFECGARRCPWR
eukprot:1776403-Prymnesium_polylepis.1